MLNKVIYVSSPFSGDIEGNTKFAIKACRFVYGLEYIPFAPHLIFPQFVSEENDRENALKMAIEMLKRCDEFWYFPRNGNLSQGMMFERMAAVDMNMKIRRFDIEDI